MFLGVGASDEDDADDYYHGSISLQVSVNLLIISPYYTCACSV